MEKLPEKLFDLHELRTIAAGDDDFFRHMVSLFISQNEEALLEIRGCFDKREFAAIQKILHKLKPSIGVMGITTATEIIKQIEETELHEIDESVFSVLLLRLDTILKEVNDQLRLL
ncbi:MAG: Hpt domain-containing protein [Bacteroidota bacterium]